MASGFNALTAVKSAPVIFLVLIISLKITCSLVAFVDSNYCLVFKEQTQD